MRHQKALCDKQPEILLFIMLTMYNLYILLPLFFFAATDIFISAVFIYILYSLSAHPGQR
ncbi:putative membrane protein [Morganella morganii]|nr:putative membrane protein [Morganella morganii]EMP50633.1 hypothetical protein C790_02513 [Morganella morganii SC01]